MSILFGRAQFTVVRGTKWDDDVTITDELTGAAVNLTGISGMTMRIREAIDTAIVLELSMANSRLTVVDATGGIMGIRVNSATTLLFPENSHEKARYVYDVVITRTATEYEAAVGGTLYVLPQVTRPWGVT